MSVVQYVRQKSIINNYTTEPNQPCDNGDWAYGTRRDCGPGCVRYECSELDPETCNQNDRMIGDNVTAEWSESPLVACTYHPSTFDLKDVNLYIEKFGEDEQFNENVMPQFCFQETTNCVDNPRTDQPWKKCPNMLADNEAGVLCRNWRSNNVELADRAQSRYCRGSNPTCGCYKRTDDPVYQIIDPEISINAGCWYAPCTQPEAYLVPSNLINSDPPCPDNTCAQINNIISNTVSNLPQSVFQNSLACDITANPIPPPTTSFFGGWWFWIFIIFIVFLIIIIMVFVFYSRKKVVKI